MRSTALDHKSCWDRDMTVISKEDKEIMAKQFSEGCNALEKFLLLLWDNGINTINCCAGHEDENWATTYITFYYDKINPDVLLAVLAKSAELHKSNIKKINKSPDAKYIHPYSIWDGKVSIYCHFTQGEKAFNELSDAFLKATKAETSNDTKRVKDLKTISANTGNIIKTNTLKPELPEKK